MGAACIGAGTVISKEGTAGYPVRLREYTIFLNICWAQFTIASLKQQQNKSILKSIILKVNSELFPMKILKIYSRNLTPLSAIPL